MTEPPLERLNYYNGRRLDAADLRLEQEYHIRVRRWLNKALVGSGIAMGLEVRTEPGTTRVVISPGVAIDHEGREIILLDERRCEVIGRGSARDGEVLGNYLTIAYRERTDAEEQGGCTPTYGERLAWGGPARIVAEPELAWTDALPHERSGRIVLAQVELNANCTAVRRVHDEVRRYVGPASEAKVRQYAIEGFRDVDEANAQTVRFHVRGRTPTAVTLYLRAEQFPSYHYTEMGQHTHGISGTISVPKHKHRIKAWNTDSAGGHTPAVQEITADMDTSVWAGVATLISALATAVAADPVTNPVGASIASVIPPMLLGMLAVNVTNPTHPLALTLSPQVLPTITFPAPLNQLSFDGATFNNLSGENVLARVNMIITMGDVPDHPHPIPAHDTELDGAGSYDLSTIAGLGPAGVNDPPGTGGRFSARSGPPLEHLYGLRIEIDGKDQTAGILQQLRDARPQQEDWTRLGDGSSNHVLALKGSGPIKLDFLPNVAFGEGEHTITFRLLPRPDGRRNGGRIAYNLYVE